MSFSQLGLSEPVLKAVAETGYVEPTPIQAQAIPVVLTGRDVLGCAQTGTGKTAGFTLPMIDILSAGRAKARMPRSLILEPTRELAAQVAEAFNTYGKYTRLTKALIVGGESMSDQEKALDRGVDVLIATPGRLLDLFERGKILLRDIKVLVIDEADRMLDMGFIPDIERIVTLLPPIRQTLFFSATMPPEIRRLADKFLSSPKEITVSRPASTATNIEDFVVPVAGADEKRDMLRKLLRSETVKTALIFCNRKRDVDILYKSLTRHGFHCGALHGDMPQDRRTATLDKFRLGEIPVLVASDVAARGLDIDDISHVFNFDVPYNSEDYVHRIGRTGRAGRSGRAFTLVTPEDGRNVGAIERLIRRNIPRHTFGEAPTEEAAPESETQRSEQPAVDLDQKEVREPREGEGERPRRARRRRGRGRGENREAPQEASVDALPAEAESRPTPPPQQEAPRSEPPPQRQRDERRRSADAPREAKPQVQQPKRTQPQSQQRRPQQDDGDDAVGFGDNVPAFLRRR